jgi:Flp pilus assembly CpaF family ATPase
VALEPVTIIIRGKHDTGKTTLANLIKLWLEENDYRHITLQDVEPLPFEKKAPFHARFERNRALRPVVIRVELG